MTALQVRSVREDVSAWSGLVTLGAWVALASVALIVVQIAIYLLWPPPETTVDFFDLLSRNPLLGILALDGLYIVSNLLAYLLYFALAVMLWRVSRSAVVVALAFGVLGMAAYMASPRPVEMLALARAYAEAGPVERVALVATGDGMLATWTGTAFDIDYFFNLVPLMVFAVLMYRSTVFSKATAAWGLAAATLMAVPSGFGTIGRCSRWPRWCRGRSSQSSLLANFSACSLTTTLPACRPLAAAQSGSRSTPPTGDVMLVAPEILQPSHGRINSLVPSARR